MQSGSSDYANWYNDSEGRYYVSYHTDSLPAHVTASSDESLSPSEVGYYIKELKEYNIIVISKMYTYYYKILPMIVFYVFQSGQQDLLPLCYDKILFLIS